LSVLCWPFGFLAPKDIWMLWLWANTRWRVFQKRVVCTKFDIYVIISNDTSSGTQTKSEKYKCDNYVFMLDITSAKFEDTKDVTTSSKPKKYRQQKGQKKKNEKTNNCRQNTTQKIKDWATRTLLKPGMNSCSLNGKQFLHPDTSFYLFIQSTD